MIRRAIYFVVALALTVGNGSTFIYLLLFAKSFTFRMIVGAALLAFVGMYCLCTDFIKATPNQEQWGRGSSGDSCHARCPDLPKVV